MLDCTCANHSDLFSQSHADAYTAAPAPHVHPPHISLPPFHTSYATTPTPHCQHMLSPRPMRYAQRQVPESETKCDAREQLMSSHAFPTAISYTYVYPTPPTTLRPCTQWCLPPTFPHRSLTYLTPCKALSHAGVASCPQYWRQHLSACKHTYKECCMLSVATRGTRHVAVHETAQQWKVQ